MLLSLLYKYKLFNVTVLDYPYFANSLLSKMTIGFTIFSECKLMYFYLFAYLHYLELFFMSNCIEFLEYFFARPLLIFGFFKMFFIYLVFEVVVKLFWSYTIWNSLYKSTQY